MRKQKNLRLIKCKRTTFDRNANFDGAKRLFSHDITFDPLQWNIVEKEGVEKFLQPNQKFEEIEFIYDEEPKAETTKTEKA